jgi:hypothetical protein
MKRSVVVTCWGIRPVDPGSPPPGLRVEESDDGATWTNCGGGGTIAPGVGECSRTMVPVARRRFRVIGLRGDEARYLRWSTEAEEAGGRDPERMAG